MYRAAHCMGVEIDVLREGNVMVLFFHLGMRLPMVVFIVGIALLFSSFGNLRVAMKTKGKPTTITAAQLSASGPPKDNAYVHVINYGVNEEYIVIQQKDAPDSDPWTGVWLQIIPADKGAVDGGKPIILKDEYIHNQSDVIDFAKYRAFDAIVCDDDSLTEPPTTPAGMHFPRVGKNQGRILEMKARPDFLYAAGLAVLGLICCVGGFLPFYFEGRRQRAAKARNTGITSTQL